MSQIIGKVGMTPRGMYDRTRAYERLDVVTYQGSSWVAIVDVPAQISPAMGSDYWQLQARMGETGPQGPVGPQGNSAFDGTGVELVNNLTQGGQTAALSAEQGKILKQELTELESELYHIVSNEVINCNGSWIYSSDIDFSTPKKITINLSQPAAYSAIVYLDIAYSSANRKDMGVIVVGTSTITIMTSSEDAAYRGIGVMLASEQQGTIEFIVEEKAIPTLYEDIAAISANNEKIRLADELLIGEYVLYSNGELWGSGSYLRTYVYKAEGISHIKAFLYNIDTVIAAIGFYNTDSITAEGYMQSSSVQHQDTQNKGKWYEADVPHDCKLITLSTRSDSASFNPSILFSSIDTLVALKKDIENLESKSFAPVSLTNGKKGWIKHGTGEFFASDATICHIFDATKISNLKAFLSSQTDVIDAVSFYSSSDITPSSYLQSSVAFKGNYPNGAWYDVSIPSDAVIICVTSGVANGFQPQILLPNAELNAMQDEKIAKLLEREIDMAAKLQFKGMGDIYHYGMDAVAYRDVINTIPSQSIYDVRFAAKAGYRCIEANLHKTSDGKYVVTHGLDGALGHDFSDLSGNDAYGVKIGSNTLDYLRSNFVYYTDKKEYEIPITTLEEFCEEAKRCGLMVMLMYADAASITIAEDILGKDMLMMYNAPRSEYKGVIFEYLYYNDKESIVARCEEVGKPYVYSMDNPAKFDDETLRDICLTLHRKGYYISSAYNSNEDREKLRGLGFDLFIIDGRAKDLAENQSIIANKVVSFNEDGSVTWGEFVA